MLSWILLPTEPRAHNGFLNASAWSFRRAPELTVWGGNGAIEGRWQKGGGMGHNCYGFVSWTASESERQPASSWLEPGAAYGGVFWEGACPVPRFWPVNRPGDPPYTPHWGFGCPKVIYGFVFCPRREDRPSGLSVRLIGC